MRHRREIPSPRTRLKLSGVRGCGVLVLGAVIGERGFVGFACVCWECGGVGLLGDGGWVVSRGDAAVFGFRCLADSSAIRWLYWSLRA